MRKAPTIVTLRVRWAGAIPRPGEWLAAPSGRAVFRVMEVQDTRMICARYDRAEVPTGKTVRPWSEFPQRKAPPPPAARARRVDHLHSLLKRGAISERQFVAAARFRDHLERARPALPVSAPDIAVVVRGAAHGVNDTHLRACRALERALSAIGPQHAPVLDWVVVSNGSLADYAQHMGLPRGGSGRQFAATHLRDALARLDMHYNPSVVGRAS